MTNKIIHKFDNGIWVYKSQLLPQQIERYKVTNLHEPEEEELFIKILNKINIDNPVIMDIGSAIGYYIILAKKIKPDVKIYAFEPLSEHRQAIYENLKINDIKTTDINIYQNAFSDSIGKAKFISNSYSSKLESAGKKIFSIASIIKLFNNAKNKSSYIEVETNTIDNFWVNDLPEIDIAKMDVQGAELNVLHGARKALKNKLIKTWIIGTHSNQLHKDCIKLLKDFNYTIDFEDGDTSEQPDGIIIASI